MNGQVRALARFAALRGDPVALVDLQRRAELDLFARIASASELSARIGHLTSVADLTPQVAEEVAELSQAFRAAYLAVERDRGEIVSILDGWPTIRPPEPTLQERWAKLSTALRRVMLQGIGPLVRFAAAQDQEAAKHPHIVALAQRRRDIATQHGNVNVAMRQLPPTFWSGLPLPVDDAVNAVHALVAAVDAHRAHLEQVRQVGELARTISRLKAIPVQDLTSVLSDARSRLGWYKARAEARGARREAALLNEISVDGAELTAATRKLDRVLRNGGTPETVDLEEVVRSSAYESVLFAAAAVESSCARVVGVAAVRADVRALLPRVRTLVQGWTGSGDPLEGQLSQGYTEGHRSQRFTELRTALKEWLGQDDPPDGTAEVLDDLERAAERVDRALALSLGATTDIDLLGLPGDESIPDKDLNEVHDALRRVLVSLLLLNTATDAAEQLILAETQRMMRDHFESLSDVNGQVRALARVAAMRGDPVALVDLQRRAELDLFACIASASALSARIGHLTSVADLTPQVAGRVAGLSQTFRAAYLVVVRDRREIGSILDGWPATRPPEPGPQERWAELSLALRRVMVLAPNNGPLIRYVAAQDQEAAKHPHIVALAQRRRDIATQHGNVNAAMRQLPPTFWSGLPLPVDDAVNAMHALVAAVDAHRAHLEQVRQVGELARTISRLKAIPVQDLTNALSDPRSRLGWYKARAARSGEAALLNQISVGEAELTAAMQELDRVLSGGGYPEMVDLEEVARSSVYESVLFAAAAVESSCARVVGVAAARADVRSLLPRVRALVQRWSGIPDPLGGYADGYTGQRYLELGSALKEWLKKDDRPDGIAELRDDLVRAEERVERALELIAGMQFEYPSGGLAHASRRPPGMDEHRYSALDRRYEQLKDDLDKAGAITGTSYAVANWRYAGYPSNRLGPPTDIDLIDLPGDELIPDEDLNEVHDALRWVLVSMLLLNSAVDAAEQLITTHRPILGQDEVVAADAVDVVLSGSGATEPTPTPNGHRGWRWACRV